jgi:hypothetical protein
VEEPETSNVSQNPWTGQLTKVNHFMYREIIEDKTHK